MRPESSVIGFSNRLMRSHRQSYDRASQYWHKPSMSKPDTKQIADIDRRAWHAEQTGELASAFDIEDLDDRQLAEADKKIAEADASKHEQEAT